MTSAINYLWSVTDWTSVKHKVILYITVFLKKINSLYVVLLSVEQHFKSVFWPQHMKHGIAQQQVFGEAKGMNYGFNMLGNNTVEGWTHGSLTWALLAEGQPGLRNSQPDCHTSHKLTKFLITFSALQFVFPSFLKSGLMVSVAEIHV